ncbi:Ig-like domain-containing protein [Pseudomonas sp. OV226]|uniref:Ig-like domain-containing protein n=1 Tax=Pseudomonas sp. OV226 TaxID=2135588 RepID=UPI0013049421|nr:Ig-like domain-containing protein [Pseudomonas sp. OV226]
MNLEGESEPALIIEDYFVEPAPEGLYGVAEDGQLHAYVLDDGAGAVANLSTGQLAPAILSANSLGSGAAYLGSSGIGGMGLSSFALAAGGLALAGGLAAASGSGSGSHANGDFVLKPTAPPPPSALVVDDASGDGKIEISGQALPGGTVTVTWPDGSISRVVVDANGNWRAESPTPQPALPPVSVVVTDPIGNVSPPATIAGVDTVAPAAASELVANDTDAGGKIDLSGKAEPGSTVTVTWPDNSTSQVPVNEDGTWNVESPTVQVSGPVSVVVTDPAGHVSPPASIVYVDTVAPLPPSSLVATDSDADGKINLSGMAEPGTTVTVSWTDGSTSEVVVEADGSWSAQSPMGQPAGSITVVAKDAAGNTSDPATVAGIDTLIPTQVVTITGLTDDVGGHVGAVANGGTTDDNTPTFFGTLSAPLGVGESLRFYDGATYLGDAGVSGTDWSFTTPYVVDGTHNFSAKIVDAAGNAGLPSSVFTLTTDILVPIAPQMSLAADTGGDTGDGLTNNKQVYVSDLEPGANWEYSSDAGLTWNLGSGNSFELSEGSHDYVVRQIDAAGNLSDSPVHTWVLDTSVPVTPSLALADDTGVSHTDGITSNNIVNVSGLDPACTSWEYSTDGGDHWQVGQGSSFSLIEGPGNYTVRQTDAAGNVSTPSSPVPYVLDTITSPDGVLPDLLMPEYSIGNYINLAESISGAGSTIVVGPYDGMAIGDVIKLNWNGTFIEHTVVLGEVGQSIDMLVSTADLQANNGSYNVWYTVTDIAGNVNRSIPQSMFVDTEPPGDPKYPVVINGSGINAAEAEHGVKVLIREYLAMDVGDVITLNWQGHTVTYTVSSADLGKDIVLDIPADKVIDLNGGAFTLSYTLTDSVANVAPGSLQTQVVVDMSPPAVPGLLLAPGNDTGADDTDGITSYLFAEVSGLELDPAGFWEYKVDSNGTWQAGQGSSITLIDGTHDYYVRQIDAAGNISDSSVAQSFTLDTITALPTLALAQDTGTNTADGVTNNDQITVTTEPGATWEYSSDGGNTWQAGSGNSFTLTEGSHSYQVRQIDIAGNVSDVTQQTFVLDISVTAPTLALAQDTGISVVDGKTKIGVVNVDGLEPGASWEYSSDGGATWQVGMGASFVLDEGSHSYTVRQTDKAGNLSPPSLAQTFELDTSVGAATLSLAQDTGLSTSDGLTSQGSVIVYGLETGASWEYRVDGGAWQSGSDTNFDLSEGAHSYVVRQTDAVGNVAVSPAYNFVLDTGVSTSPTLSLEHDTGASDSDGITSNNVVKVNGLETGASWEYSNDGGFTWQLGSGTSFILDEGSHSYAVRQADAAGNSSIASPAQTFVLASLELEPPSGLVVNDGDGDGRIEISGVAQPGSTVTVTWPDGSKSQIPVASDGKWSAEAAATQPIGTVSVVASDLAGNVSLPAVISGVDSIAPPAPSDLVADDTDADGKISLSGKGEPGSTITVTWPDGISNSQTTVDADGNWSVESPTVQTSGPVSVISTDAANHDSPPASINYVDTVAPAAPTDLVAADANGDRKIELVGKAEPGSTVTVTWANGTDTTTVLVGDDGTWSAQSPVSQPPGSISVVATDAAGHKSDAATIASIDTSLPASAITIVGISDNAGGHTGTVPDGGETDDNTPTLLGTLSEALQPGETLRIYDGATYLGDAVVTDTNWTFTPPVLGDGTHQFSAKIINAAGNSGLPSSSFTLITDIVAPLVPVLTLAADTGSDGNDHLTNNNRVNVGGLEPGASWEYSVDHGTTWKPLTGNSFTLVEGSNDCAVRQTDAAGNVSQSPWYPYVLDITAPLLPAFALDVDSGISANDRITNNGMVNVSGLDGSSRWEYSADGADWHAGSGSSFVLSEGEHSYAVRQIDAAGNISTSPTTTYTLDTAPAAALSPLHIPEYENGFYINAAEAADGTSVTLEKYFGMAAGDVIKLVWGGQEFELWTVDASEVGGDLNLVVPAAILELINGSFNIAYSVTDLAGNVSMSTPQSMFVDTVPPDDAKPPVVINGGGGINADEKADGIQVLIRPYTGMAVGDKINLTWDGAPVIQVPPADPVYIVTQDDVDNGYILLDVLDKYVLDTGGSSVQISYTLTDSAGNAVANSNTVLLESSIVVDLIPPVAPTLALRSDTGVAGDDITQDGQVNVTGLEPGATWQYSLDGGATWNSGNGGAPWNPGDAASFTLSLGSHSYAVRQTDAAGNVSAYSAAQSYELDITAAAAPTLTLAADTGSSNGDGITQNNLVNVGGLEAGATWEYSIDGGTWISGSGGAPWSPGNGANFVLGAGSHVYAVRQTDIAGNVSAVEQQTFVLDTSVAVPTLTLAADTGSSASDGITKHNLVNVGALEDGASWEYSADGGTTWFPGTGNSFALSDGSHSYKVRQIDVAGNVSVASAARIFVLDMSVVVPTLSLAVDTGSSASDGITRTNLVNVGGLEASASWQYSYDGGASWSEGTGSSFTLIDGSHSYVVRQTDKAGNLAISSTQTYVLDTGAPAAASLALALDTGMSNSDGITNSGVVNISGLEAGASWQYQVDGSGTWVNGSGTSFTLGNGSHTYAVRQIDTAGNLSAVSATQTLVLDTTAFSAPTLALVQDTGKSTSDSITNNKLVNVAGLESGYASWEYSVDGGAWQAGSGTTFSLGEGSHSYAVRQTDKAGNVSVASTVKTWLLDTVADAPQLVVSDFDGNNRPNVVGKAEPGSTVTVKWPDGTTSNVLVDGNGNWGTEASAVQNAGPVLVQQTDTAGNVSGWTTAQYFVPAAPVNTYTLGEQARPVISKLGDGGWVVVWHSLNQLNSGSDYDLYQQRYDKTGAKLGGETLVNTVTTNTQADASVTQLKDGGWLVTWWAGGTSNIYQQRYSADGLALGGQTKVNTDATDIPGPEMTANVTALASGGWVVAWVDSNDGSGTGIYQQLFDASGAALGGQTRVNNTTTNDQKVVSLAGLPDGGWVAAWQSYQGNTWDMYTQRYDKNGTKIGPTELLAGSNTTMDHHGEVKVLADGSWVLVWTGNDDVWQQHFNSDGSKAGTYSQVNSYATNEQREPQVTALADGGWVVAWESNGQDGSGTGIYQQRYNAVGAKVGGETRVNTYTSGNQGGFNGTSDWNASVHSFDITTLNDGGWVVTWQSTGQDGSSSGIYQQRYDAAGNAVGGEGGSFVFNLNANAVAELSGDAMISHLSGSNGARDAIVLNGGNITLDLSLIGQKSAADAGGVARLQSIEHIDLTGSGNNTLQLTVQDVLDLSQSNQLVVDGNDKDFVIAQGFTQTGVMTANGHTYVVYTGSNGAETAQLLIDTTIDRSGVAGGVTPPIGLVLALDTGIAGDGVTLNNTVVVDGLQPGTSWEFSSDGGTTWTAGTGSSFNLINGAHSYAVRQTQGSSLVTSVLQHYSLDTTVAAPQIVVADADGDNLPEVSGKAEPGSTVTVKWPDGSSTQVLTDSNGYWSLEAPRQQIAGTVSVTQTDAAGNLSAAATAPYGVPNAPVNTYTTENQVHSAQTQLPDGGWVVAWQSKNQYSTTSGWDLYQQRYDATGKKVGAETLVTTTSVAGGGQADPSITTLKDGSWVVAFHNGGSNGDDVYQRHFDANGVPLGAEVKVNGGNTATTSVDAAPDVTALASGGWVVTWMGTDSSNWGVYQNLYNASGVKVYGDRLVNATQNTNQQNANTTALADGGWITVWESLQNGNQPDIYMQRFDAGGNKLKPNGTAGGTESVVGNLTNEDRHADVAALAGGGWVVTWAGYNTAHDVVDIYQQRFTAAGVGQGQVMVNTSTAYAQEDPVVTGLADGGYVVAWTSNGQDGAGMGIYQQRYDASGAKVGGETQVNTYTTGNQGGGYLSCEIIDFADGGWLVTWQSEQDGASSGIYQQRYDAAGNAVGGEGSSRVFNLDAAAVADLSDTLGAPLLGSNGGYDGIVLTGANSTLDLTDIAQKTLTDPSWAARLQSIEHIDLTGVGDNTLNLSVQDVLDLSQTNQLVVDGNAGDKVMGAGWTWTRTIIAHGHTYEVYMGSNGAEAAQLLVDTTIDRSAVLSGGTPTLGLALAQDTGISTNDGVTKNSLVNVGGLEAGTSWQYSVDGGVWQTGTGNTFNLTEGVHRYQVQQADHTSAERKLVLATTAPTPQLVVSDPDGDHLPNVAGKVTPGATVMVKWADNSTTNVLADANGYWSVEATTVPSNNTVQVQYTDLAGNVSAWASAQCVVPNASVNTFTTGQQMRGEPTKLPDGGWVVVWQSFNQLTGTSNWDLFQQRYDATGAKVGVETRVSGGPTGGVQESDAAVTALADGSWVVTWQSPTLNNVYYRHFDANGVALTDAVKMNAGNTGTSGPDAATDITALKDGGWLATWLGTDSDSRGVFQDRYDNLGNKIGSGDTRVNSTATGDQSDANTTALVDGGWVTVWQGGQGGSINMYMQRFNPNGSMRGGEIQLSVDDLDHHGDVAALADGGWVVTWNSTTGTTSSGNTGIVQLRYNAAGEAQGTPTSVNTTVAGEQREPVVTGLADGGWVVAWESENQDGSGSGIFQQRYAADGSKLGGEIQVNSFTAGNQGHWGGFSDWSSYHSFAISDLKDGGWIVTWESTGQDGSAEGVYQQRFDATGNAVGGEGSSFVFNLDAPAVAVLSADTMSTHLVGSAGGHDALVLSGQGIELDLTLIGQKSVADPGHVARLQSIEHIDLSGSGANTLRLTVQDMLDLSQTNQLVVDGNADDKVIAQGWTQTGTMSAAGHSYAVYMGSNGTEVAQLLIDTTINRNGVIA